MQLLFEDVPFYFQENLPSYPDEGYPPQHQQQQQQQQYQQDGEEPFNTLEIRLIRQVSGFGFRIIGGREEGSQVSEQCMF